ncbi:MAG: putative peptidoglycan glycosyltransferase FtsW [Candidatus Paceibacterota bacterium]|jgi:cell division protein FtsW
MSQKREVDKVFFSTVLIMAVLGFAVFTSASMGILAKDSAKFASIMFRQVFWGLFVGFVACYLVSRLDYRILKKYSFYIFLLSVISMILVFVPQLGVSINGAKRWIDIAGMTFQPIEILNTGFIIYLAAWFSFVKDKIEQFRYSLLPLLILLGISGILLLLQPDADSFLILGFVGVVMLVSAGGKFKHIIAVGLIGLLFLVVLALSRPYIMTRITSFFNPADNAQSSGYQIQQSLIAVGSGGMFGRGLGQSIQKFKFLPESISDSIFAVAGEELGFIGCIFIILLFLFFVFRAFRIAIRSPDSFGGLLVIGIVILITCRSFMNIASMLGVIPISGVPLAFFSQGGTAMFITLIQIGIIISVSRSAKLQQKN